MPSSCFAPECDTKSADPATTPLSLVYQPGAKAPGRPWNEAMNLHFGSSMLSASVLPECLYNNTQARAPPNQPGSTATSEPPTWMWQGPETSSSRSSGDLPSQENWQHIFQQEWALLSNQPNSAAESSPNSAFTNDLSNNFSSTNSITSSHDDNSHRDKDHGSVPKSPCIVNTVRQLSELNVELFAHAVLVPKPPSSVSEPLSWKGKDFAIDRILQLSQKFIHILNAQYPRFLASAAMTGHAHSPGSSPDVSSPLLDQGCLLILSCYLRLVDTYDDVFGNMQACLDRSSITPEEDYVHLPGVQVGSFTLPQSSALQIVLILQLSRHLLSRIGEIFRAAGIAKSENISSLSDAMGAPPGDGSEQRDLHTLISSAIDTVSKREQRLMERIAKLRSTLIELNIL